MKTDNLVEFRPGISRVETLNYNIDLLKSDLEYLFRKAWTAGEKVSSLVSSTTAFWSAVDGKTGEVFDLVKAAKLFDANGYNTIAELSLNVNSGNKVKITDAERTINITDDLKKISGSAEYSLQIDFGAELTFDAVTFNINAPAHFKLKRIDYGETTYELPYATSIVNDQMIDLGFPVSSATCAFVFDVTLDNEAVNENPPDKTITVSFYGSQEIAAKVVEKTITEGSFRSLNPSKTYAVKCAVEGSYYNTALSALLNIGDKKAVVPVADKDGYIYEIFTAVDNGSISLAYEPGSAGDIYVYKNTSPETVNFTAPNKLTAPSLEENEYIVVKYKPKTFTTKAPSPCFAGLGEEALSKTKSYVFNKTDGVLVDQGGKTVLYVMLPYVFDAGSVTLTANKTDIQYSFDDAGAEYYAVLNGKSLSLSFPVDVNEAFYAESFTIEGDIVDFYLDKTIPFYIVGANEVYLNWDYFSSFGDTLDVNVEYKIAPYDLKASYSINSIIIQTKEYQQ